MKIYSYLLFIPILLMLSGYALAQQKLEISFESHYYGQALGLDSVLIRNITTGRDTSLYAPDTVLVLDYAVGFNDYSLGETAFSVSPNYPNPVIHGSTSFDVNMPEAGLLTLHATDVSGEKLAIIQQRLERGQHHFTYYPPSKGISLIWASDGKNIGQVKIINVGEPLSLGKRIVHQYSKAYHSMPGKKSKSSVFEYNWADTLWYIGYSITPDGIAASDVLEDSPDMNSHVSFGIIEGLPCTGTEAIKHGGKLYATVEIEGVCWLKENLNIGLMIHSDSTMTDNGIIEKYCYDNDPGNCREYGGLYQWGELMNYTQGDGAQGICPLGWHITSIDEWNDLTDIHPGFTLKERGTSHWIEGTYATNSTGLTILPGGYKWWSDGSFEQLTAYAGFFTSTELPSPPSWGVWVKGFSWNESGSHSGNAYTTHGDSVRCIKDAD